MHNPGYDPQGRLFQISTSSTSRFLYDGTDIIAEYSGAGTLLRRYVHGTGRDEPIVWYEGAGTNDRRSLVADERGSIVAVTNSTGALLAINTYDAFGQPGAANLGRFQFTGQIWMAELGLYHDKARAYSPALGRFLQPDPIQYKGGMNLYAYVGNDPVNNVDPTGLEYEAIEPIVVTGTREDPWAALAKYLLLAQIREMDSGGDPRIRDNAREPQSNNTPVPCLSAGTLDSDTGDLTPAAFTPDGDTKGDNPDNPPGSGRWNTDLPGGWPDAVAVFNGLRRLAGDTSSQMFPGMATSPNNWNVVEISYPSRMMLRVGIPDMMPRIDIPANVFQLRKHETIHFKGGKGNMCPTP